MDSRTSIVKAGYDTIAESYLRWEGGAVVRAHYLQKLMEALPAHGTVLDLGCGAGIPVARLLSKQHSVVGVDISDRQINLARQHVPQAQFIVQDIVEASFPPQSFDAVGAFFSLTHVPRNQHSALLQRIVTWLKPNGLFLASLGAEDTADFIEKDWLGAPMFFSHFDAQTNRSLVRTAGLQIVHESVVEHMEDEHAVSFLWVIARKNSQSAI